MNKKKIIIIDSKIGNVGSISRAVDNVGFESKISNDLKEIEKASHVILPGVGSFDEGMKKINYFGIYDLILELAKVKQRPFLGICLGMQLLASDGFENGKKTVGLDLIPGSVKRIKTSKEFKLPHIGWNEIVFSKNNSIFKDIPDKSDFYFIHSYKFICQNIENEIAKTKYCENFSSIIKKDNIIGVQFHPEKSLDLGLKLIKNFLNT